MKAEELMFGDYARVCGENLLIEKGTIVKILGVDGDHTFKELKGAAYCMPLDRDQFNSGIWVKHLDHIPLTPEILEKNGFKDTDIVIVGTRKLRWTSDDERTEITIWMDDTLPMEIVKNVYYEDEVSYTLPFPGTVHQLQHALRLCEIDKEIVL